MEVVRCDQKYSTKIIIPAYDSNNRGLTIPLVLNAYPYKRFLINCEGSVAEALKRNLQRTIEIMSNIKKSWKVLLSFEYHMQSALNNFNVQDARSSSLALSIALINIYREHHNQCQVSDLTGSGILRLNGELEKSRLEDQKKHAIKDVINSIDCFITSDVCNHLLKLEKIINQYNIQEAS